MNLNLKDNMHRIQQGGSFIMFVVFFLVVVGVAYMFGRWSNPQMTISEGQIRKQETVESHEKGSVVNREVKTWYYPPSVTQLRDKKN